MKKTLIISLVILALLGAISTHGLAAAAFSLVAFSLLFYFVSTQQDHHSKKD